MHSHRPTERSTQLLEEGGALILKDTCPEVTPYNRSKYNHLLTNSLKAEHYLTSGLNRLPTSVMPIVDCVAHAIDPRSAKGRHRSSTPKLSRSTRPQNPIKRVSSAFRVRSKVAKGVHGARTRPRHRCPHHLPRLREPRHGRHRRTRPSSGRRRHRRHRSRLSKRFGVHRCAVRLDGADLHRPRAEGRGQSGHLPAHLTGVLPAGCALRPRLWRRPVHEHQHRRHG